MNDRIALLRGLALQAGQMLSRSAWQHDLGERLIAAALDIRCELCGNILDDHEYPNHIACEENENAKDF